MTRDEAEGSESLLCVTENLLFWVGCVLSDRDIKGISRQSGSSGHSIGLGTVDAPNTPECGNVCILQSSFFFFKDGILTLKKVFWEMREVAKQTVYWKIHFNFMETMCSNFPYSHHLRLYLLVQ